MTERVWTVEDTRRMLKGLPPLTKMEGGLHPPPPTLPGIFSDLPLTDEQRSALSEAGLNSIMVLRAATDSELLAVPTIGRATVANLRERLGGD